MNSIGCFQFKGKEDVRRLKAEQSCSHNNSLWTLTYFRLSAEPVTGGNTSAFAGYHNKDCWNQNQLVNWPLGLQHSAVLSFVTFPLLSHRRNLRPYTCKSGVYINFSKEWNSIVVRFLNSIRKQPWKNTRTDC